jgi:hypothetical protein
VRKSHHRFDRLGEKYDLFGSVRVEKLPRKGHPFLVGGRSNQTDAFCKKIGQRATVGEVRFSRFRLNVLKLIIVALTINLALDPLEKLFDRFVNRPPSVRSKGGDRIS